MNNSKFRHRNITEEEKKEKLVEWENKKREERHRLEEQLKRVQEESRLKVSSAQHFTQKHTTGF